MKFKLDTKNYHMITTFIALKDIQENHIGYIVIYKNSPELMNLSSKFTNRLMVISAINILIFLFLYYFIKLQNTSKNLSNTRKILNKNLIISRTDLDGKIIEVSESFEKISGYKNEELLGQTHNIIKHPDMNILIYEEIWKKISNNETWYGEIKNKRKDNSFYWVLSEITPEYNSSDIKIGYIAIRHDISDKKDLELNNKRLLQSEKMADMGSMISNIAHQWRQPLSVISTSATALLFKNEMDMIKQDDIKKACESIDKNAQYLSKTIDDFRNFINNDREKTIFNLKENIYSFQSLVYGVIKTNDINLILQLDEQITIDGYENELIQCYLNIFNNAKDAFNEQNIKDKYLFIRTIKKDNNIIISFKDNANGIPHKILEKIFDPYFTTKHQSQGTGIGLNMTFNLITKGMSGMIEASNVSYVYKEIKYEGALFTITIPN